MIGLGMGLVCDETETFYMSHNLIFINLLVPETALPPLWNLR